MNTGLTLRTAQIRDGVATVRAGATLLFDSDPEAEERETELKASALLGALAAVDQPHARGRSAHPAEQPGEGMKVLLVDHEDSFVNTLADYFRQQGAEVVTLRHGFPRDDARRDRARPRRAVARPRLAVRLRLPALIDALYARDLPVFGVCLGLQAMVEHAGGALELLALPRARQARPGRRLGGGDALLDGLPEEFTAARYHSLHAKRAGRRRLHRHRAHAGRRGHGDRGHRNGGASPCSSTPSRSSPREGGAGAKVIANVLRLCAPPVRTPGCPEREDLARRSGR